MTDPIDVAAIQAQYDRYCEASDKDENLVHEAMLCADNVVPLLARIAELEARAAEDLASIQRWSRATVDARAERDAVARERDGVREELTRMAGDLDAARGWLALRDGELVSANAQRDAARAERDRLAVTVERVRTMCTDLEPCDSCGRGRVGLAEEVLKVLPAPAQRAQDGPTNPSEGERTGAAAPRVWVALADRDEAAEAVRKVLHELQPRIPALNVPGCHCNLLAEVALDVLTGTVGVAE